MFELSWYVQEVQTKIIEEWTDTYICNSKIWTEETESKWSIYKVDTNGNKIYAVSKMDWLPTNNMQFLPSEYLDLEYSYGRYTTLPIATFTINNGDLTTINRDVTIEVTLDSYVNVVAYLLSESDKLDITKFSTVKPTTFTLSEWLGSKTIYLYVKDWSGKISTVTSETIELI